MANQTNPNDPFATPAPDYDKITEERKAAAEKRLSEERKTIEARTTAAYEHEDPTPTQAENDAAKLAAMGGQEEIQPEGSGWHPTPSQVPDSLQRGTIEQKRKQSEANPPAGGGYQTKTTTAADSSKPATGPASTAPKAS